MSDDIVTRLRMSADLIVEFPKMLAKNISSQWIFEAADEIERLRGLLLIFDTHFVCEECDKACATYLQGCENPLHALHTAAWELF